MSALAISVLLASAWTIPAAADSGDDTSNNLFSDISPLLSLFGEQFAKQFMSESMGWLDNIIFVMAPLGILTAIVAAIRVGGPSWLKAVIGRARENLAAVEVELMSSTSHEVCELWNGQSIVRTMGRPAIQHIVYLEDYKHNGTFGLYTVEGAKNDGLLKCKTYDDPVVTAVRKMLPRRDKPNVQDSKTTKQSIRYLVRTLGEHLNLGLYRHPTPDLESHREDGESVSATARPSDLSQLSAQISSGSASRQTDRISESSSSNRNATHDTIEPPELNPLPAQTSSGPASRKIDLTASELSDLDQNANQDLNSAPNISLNLHGGSKTMELFITAFCGIVLQSGMLVFCGFSVYHPKFSQRFPKNGSPVQPYAFPTMAIGTVILTVGILICSAIVEKSTEEKEYVLMPNNNTDMLSSTEKPRSEISSLWLQKTHTVSDQAFDSFVLFGNSSSSQDRILTSRRKDPSHKLSSDDRTLNSKTAIHRDASPSNTLQPVPLVERIASTRTEVATLFGVILGLSGFILQFEGLRGMNWSASIVQLVCVFLMTILRAVVRRGLVTRPTPRRVPKNHEMDWLALRIAMCWTSAPTLTFNRFADSKTSEDDGSKFLSWKIYTSDKNHTCAGTFSSTMLNRASMPDLTRPTAFTPFTHEKSAKAASMPNLGRQITATYSGYETNSRAQIALNVRRHLGQLTNWTVQASVASISIADSIELIMNAFFEDSESEYTTFTWPVNVMLDESEDCVEMINFKVERNKGEWRVDATYLEAALSLWLFYLQKSETRIEDMGLGRDRLRKDRSLKQTTDRILGPNISSLRTNIKWWIGDGIGLEDSASGENRGGLQFGFLGCIRKPTLSNLVI